MKKIFFQLHIIFCISITSYSQGEIQKPDGSVFIENERSVGIYLNSNGLGLDLRLCKRQDALHKRLFEFQLVNIKHPKEVKSRNQYYENQSFIYGKYNHFYNLRTGIGRQREIFSKFDKGGIAIRYYYSGGVSLGVLKPIYYEILYTNPVTKEHYIVNETFDPAKHHSIYEIQGKASYFEGIKKTSVIPGLYLKFGFNFEYSKIIRAINALEAGVLVDGFLKEVPIMATESNNRFFLSLFVLYRFGKLYSQRLKNIKMPSETE